MEDDDFNQEPHYYKMIKEMQVTEHYYLDLDCDHLFQHDQALYKQLENYPSEVLELFDVTATDYLKDLMNIGNHGDAGFGEQGNDFNIQVLPKNLRKIHHVRGLDPQLIDKLVSIKGIIIRVSSVLPDMQAAYYKCIKCGLVVHEQVS